LSQQLFCQAFTPRCGVMATNMIYNFLLKIIWFLGKKRSYLNKIKL